MKLKNVHVEMFRNILDSTLVEIDPRITCLVGKNESGKTAFLQALWRLNPARLSPKFSVPDHYPAWLEKRHRNARKNLDEVQVVQATFTWEPGDIEAVEAVFGANVVPNNGTLTLGKKYTGDFTWTHGCNERAAVENFIANANLSKVIVKRVKGASTFAELFERIAVLKQDQELAGEVAGLDAMKVSAEELLDDDSFNNALWEVVLARVPEFFYFADYSKLPYSVKIKHILESPSDKLSDSEATAKALLRLGGAEKEYLTNPDYERRKRELENVANSLTDDVLKYWSQNPELRVQPEITQVTERRADGQHSVLDEMKIRIWDNRHFLSLPFTEHSAGFQWFFSFLAAFSEYEHSDPPVVILLDEPAVGLHAKAQDDFLRFIEERLADRCQVIYTTHSPFMVQPGHLERVRMVEDKSKEVGSTVSSDVLSRDADTLFPLQSALGYDLVQHLFVRKDNLVVEGTSDFTFLTAMSDHCGSLGRERLDPKWSVVPVGGADAIPTFVALLGNHLDVTVLVDSRKEGNQRLTKMAADGYLSKKRLILIGEIAGQKLADIEDLFTIGEYLALYNKAFDGKVTEADLKGTDQIVNRIARHIGVDRFDHGKPADWFLRHRDKFLPTLSKDTLDRFESLFKRINATLGK